MIEQQEQQQEKGQ